MNGVKLSMLPQMLASDAFFNRRPWDFIISTRGSATSKFCFNESFRIGNQGFIP
jgi:hypothetical protein